MNRTMKKKILTLTSLVLLCGVSIAEAKTGFYVGAEGGVNFLRLQLKEAQKTEGFPETSKNQKKWSEAFKSRAGDFGIFAGYGHQYPSTFYLGFQAGGGINFAKKTPESINETISDSSSKFILMTMDMSLTLAPNPKYYYNAEMHIGYSILPKMLFYGIVGIEGKAFELGGRGILNTKLSVLDSIKDKLGGILNETDFSLEQQNKVLNFSSDMMMVANVSGKDETIEGFDFPKTNMKKTNVLVGVLGLGTQYSITPNIDIGCAVKAKLGVKNKLNMPDATVQHSHFSLPDEVDQAIQILVTSAIPGIKALGSDGKTVFAKIEEIAEEKAKQSLKELRNFKIRAIDYSVALSLRYRF